MKDDFNDPSLDAQPQKSVTDWLMQVISGKQQPIELHIHNATAPVVPEEGHTAEEAITRRAPEGAPQEVYAAGSAVAVDDATPQIETPYTPETPILNGASHTVEVVESEFSAEDLCGAPIFAMPEPSQEEITAEDLCWVPKGKELRPQLAEDLDIFRPPAKTDESEKLEVTAEDISKEELKDYLVEPQESAIDDVLRSLEPEAGEITPVDISRPTSLMGMAMDIRASGIAPEVAEPEPVDIWAIPAGSSVQQAEPSVELDADASVPEEAVEVEPIEISAIRAEPVVHEAEPAAVELHASAEEATAAAAETYVLAETVEDVPETVEVAAEPEHPEPEPQPEISPIVTSPIVAEEIDPEIEVHAHAVDVDAMAYEAEPVTAGGVMAAEAANEPAAQTDPKMTGGMEDIAQVEAVDADAHQGRFEEVMPEADRDRDALAEAAPQLPETQLREQHFYTNAEQGETILPTDDTYREPTYRERRRLYREANALKEMDSRPEGWNSAWRTMLRLGSVLPWLARMLPMLEAGAGSEQGTGLVHEVRQEVASIRLVQYEIKTTIQDHSLQLKRIEEQLGRVRDSLDTSHHDDLAENVRSTTKLVQMVGIGIGALLIVLIALVGMVLMRGK